ncbi:hypothetical protein [Planococcus shixiaomingii]|uniref:hypothetical protein n=1 Tax=Planococcus shixiaomingii TaxID=3058393 RepID=UPI0026286FC3|nr:hypothetical protein [Planococcus sp. N022]WKA53220.1 hypothetical protein QWY21_11170 [Planococcus sp. N022]
MKKLILTILIIVLAGTAGALYILTNPPLVGGAVYSSPDKKTVMVGVGNDGFKGIQIDKVSVNGGMDPLSTVVQVNDALKGFFITPEFEEKDAPFNFDLKRIDEVTIPPDTDPLDVYEKLDAGTATVKDKIYGLGIIHEQEVKEITIHYRYLGLPLRKTVKNGA